jgi:hypothetical protein
MQRKRYLEEAQRLQTPHNMATMGSNMFQTSPKSNHQTANAVVASSTLGYLLRILHLFILSFALLRKQVLLLARALDLIGNELLVLLEGALNMQLEAYNVVEHALNFGMQLFS